MLLKGSFRVVDTGSGVSAKGEPRASVTMSDKEEAGQFKVTFGDGKIPSAFAMDALVTDFSVKPAMTKFGMMLVYVPKAEKTK
jgi:hypothetical protein